MGVSKSGVVYTLVVKNFRNTLNPEDRELFNECIMRIYRDPRVDRIHKFTAVLQAPLVDCVYRDDNFIIIYRWEQLTNPIVANKVTVLQATWTVTLDRDY